MEPSLRDRKLLRERAWIDGRFVDADDGGRFAVRNPATGDTIATVPACGAAETRRAIEAAAEAFPGWANRTAAERASRLRDFHAAVCESREDLARILTAEQGKPLEEARAEVAYGAAFLLYYAEEARRTLGETIPSPWPGSTALVTREPVGVVAAITPWNFPSAMILRKVAPALAAGCPVVLKPAEQTPLSALALAELARRAGLGGALLQVVTGPPEPIGAELSAHPAVRKLSFTGSTDVGRRLLAACAPTIKRVSLELGGHAPFLVFDDADLARALEGAMAAKFRNAGQTCVCPNRFLVQETLAERFAEELAARARRLRVGPGTEEGVQIGPLIDEAGLAKVEAHVADAVEKGAQLLCGGARHALGGTFYQPTVLLGATREMRLAREETFGPVAPVFRFRDEDEAVALANDTEYGLAAYLYTRDLGRAFRVSRALESGMVAVNAGMLSTEVAPFGGVKQSGLGREGGHPGIAAFLEMKYTLVATG